MAHCLRGSEWYCDVILDGLLGSVPFAVFSEESDQVSSERRGMSWMKGTNDFLLWCVHLRGKCTMSAKR